MIISSFKNNKKTLKYMPVLKPVFNFIKDNIKTSVKEGRYEIGGGIYAVIQTSDPKPEKERLLETHKKYVDLQYVISGSDKIGWKFYDKTFKVFKKYDKKNDITFFKNSPDFFITLKKGEFAVFFNQDAHAPLCGVAAVKKCVFKIPAGLI